MKIVILNSSSDSLSYVSGLVAIPANGSLDVPQGLWKRMYSDLTFITDLRNSNLIINDGVTSYRYPNSEELIKYAIDRIDFSPVRKDFTYSTTQTNTVLWTPASGKKFVITDYSINIR